MRSFLLATVATLACGAIAMPGRHTSKEVAPRGLISDITSTIFGGDDNNDNCLNQDRAQQVATNFKNLIATYSDSLANQTLTVDFVDSSDSVNTLIDGGCPNGPAALGSATFTGRAAFEKGQGSQPPIPFQQLNLWYTCHTVIIRWYSDMSPERVTGIIVLETKPSPKGSKYKDLIKTVFSEFNSGAWLVDLGVFKPTCS